VDKKQLVKRGVYMILHIVGFSDDFHAFYWFSIEVFYPVG